MSLEVSQISPSLIEDVAILAQTLQIHSQAEVLSLPVAVARMKLRCTGREPGEGGRAKHVPERLALIATADAPIPILSGNYILADDSTDFEGAKHALSAAYVLRLSAREQVYTGDLA